MKKHIYLTVALLTYFNVYSQSITHNELKKLIPFFKVCNNQSVLEELPSKELSSGLLQKIFTGNSEGELEIYAVCIKQFDFGMLLFLKTGFAQYESYDLEAVLVYENGIYKIRSIGDNSYNSDETANAAETCMANDSIIQLIQRKYDFDFSNELDKDYHYFLVNEDGINQILLGEYSGMRKYVEGSVRILEKESLKNFSKHELDIMRNEIFADHGYKFKSKKWQDYFRDKEWYNPRYDDVTDSLSVVEKINVKLILKASKKM